MFASGGHDGQGPTGFLRPTPADPGADLGMVVCVQFVDESGRIVGELPAHPIGVAGPLGRPIDMEVLLAEMLQAMGQ